MPGTAGVGPRARREGRTNGLLHGRCNASLVVSVATLIEKSGRGNATPSGSPGGRKDSGTAANGRRITMIETFQAGCRRSPAVLAVASGWFRPQAAFSKTARSDTPKGDRQRGTRCLSEAKTALRSELIVSGALIRLLVPGPLPWGLGDPAIYIQLLRAVNLGSSVDLRHRPHKKIPAAAGPLVSRRCALSSPPARGLYGYGARPPVTRRRRRSRTFDPRPMGTNRAGHGEYRGYNRKVRPASGRIML